MAITYSTNWMGPVTNVWYEERGLDPTGDRCCAGRIDIRGVPDEPYGLEYRLAPMHAEDWNDLSGWLDDFETHDLWSYEDLIAQYEEERGTKIRWID